MAHDWSNVRECWVSVAVSSVFANEDDGVDGGITSGDWSLDVLPLVSLAAKKLVTGAGDNDDSRCRLVAVGMVRVGQNAARAKGIQVECAIVATPSMNETKPR